MLGQVIGLNLFRPHLGVDHADDLFLLFKPHQIPIEGVFTAQDKLTSQNLLRMWTDFAKTGNPTPDKNSVQWSRLHYVLQ
jgi:carboxylesterase type B